MSGNREELHRWMIRIRRDLHRHPEIAFEEVRTTQRIVETLRELGLEPRTFDDLTGCTALIEGGEGPVLGLRADIDALPMAEQTEVKYKSVNDGVMHSCGHDGHAAILLGTAKHLIESGLAEQLPGSVKLVFQPAEERDGGAKFMIERGVLENPRIDWMIGAHLFPGFPVGWVGVPQREAMASADAFTLTIKGVGGHGSMPHETRDPILAAGHVIVAVQSIVSRNVDPREMGVISFGAMEAGTVENIIPAEAQLTGTIRAFSEEVRELLISRLEKVAESTCRALEVESEFRLIGGYPPTINDEAVSAFVRRVAEQVPGADRVETTEPISGSEDFSYFGQERPSAYFFIGSGNEERGIVHPPHSPFYEMDEEALLLGVDLYTRIVQEYFNR